jgi:hypothetical protein
LNFTLDGVAANAQAGCGIPLQTSALALRSNGLFVWPGDTNHNGAVELTDVNVLGLHWEIAGPKRLGLDDQTAWRPQLAQRFAPRAATHADADGSGRIDERDIFPIGLNWRKTRTSSAAPKAKRSPAPEGRVSIALFAHAPRTYRLQINFQNRNHAELAGLAFRMNYSGARAEVASVQSGPAWGSAPLLLQHDDQNARTLAVGLMIPNGELTRAGAGALAEILINAAEAPRQEDFMFNEFVVVSPSGESRELEVQTNEDERVAVIPREMILHPAHPNPFRLDDAAALQHGMRIQYDLPENAAVSVAIYNTVGARVRLISAILNESGRHYLHWEGLSDMGRAVSSGLYLVKIEAAGESGRAYQATQKVTLVR